MEEFALDLMEHIKRRRSRCVVVLGLCLMLAGCRANRSAIDQVPPAVQSALDDASTGTSLASQEGSPRVPAIAASSRQVTQKQPKPNETEEVAPQKVENLPPTEKPREWKGDSLTLEQVVESVQTTYPLLRSAFYNQRIAAGEQLGARGAFDLNVSGGHIAQPMGFYKNYRSYLNAKRYTMWGGQSFLGYRVGDGNFPDWYKERETDEGGELKAGMSIPLLKDRAIDKRRAELARSDLERAAASPGIEEERLMFLLAAADAYWNWVAAGQVLEIAQQLLKIAEDRNAGLKKSVDAGNLPKIELTDNERLIVGRQAKLIQAQRKVEQSSIKLSLFFRTPEGAPLIPPPSALPDGFSQPIPMPDDIAPSLISTALRQRPEPRRLELVSRQVQVDLAQARNQLLPGLDVAVAASKDVGAPASSLRDKTPFELEASVLADVPLQRRAARGKVISLEGKLAQVTAKRRFVNDQITAEVQDALSALSNAYEAYQRARRAVELNRTLEQAERRKLELGDSDILTVNLREQATADAALVELGTLLEYHQALAMLRVAQGASPVATGKQLFLAPPAPPCLTNTH